MSDKQRKIKDRASKAFVENRLKQALELYQAVVDEDPSEIACRIKIGDIYRKLGQKKDAIEAYEEVAIHYAEDGLLLKAIAVCKLILGVDATHTKTQEMLANLYSKREGRHVYAPRTMSGVPSPLDSASARERVIDLNEGAGDMIVERGVGTEERVSAAPTPPTPPMWPPPPAPPARAPEVEVRPAPKFAWPVATPAAPESSPPVIIGSKVIVGQRVAGAASSPSAPPAASAPPAPALAAAGAPPAGPAPAVRAAWPGAIITGTPAVIAGTPATPPPSGPAATGGGSPPPRTPEPAPRREVEATLLTGDLDALGSGDEGLAEAAEGPELDIPIDEANLDEALVVEEPEELGASSPPQGSDAAEGAPAMVAGVPVFGPTLSTDIVFSEDESIAIEDAEEAAAMTPAEPVTVQAVAESPPPPAAASPPAASPDPGAPEPQALPQIPLFSDLPREAFIEILVRMKMRELSAGAVVIQQGEVGASFFILASGRVRVSRRSAEGEDTILAYLTDGAFFGEMALLQDGARTASVVVEEESQLFELDRALLDHIVTRFPGVARVLRNFYMQRLLSTTMATHPLFRSFSPQDRRDLMERFKSRPFKSGDVLMREGQRGEGLYLLLSGRLEVSKNRDGSQIVISELESGDMFGEMSLLANRPTIATVTAVSDSLILRLSKRDFDEVIMTHPQVLEFVAKVSEERETENSAILGAWTPRSEEGAALV